MKKSERFEKPPRRRDAALATSYTQNELYNLTDEQKKVRLQKFMSSSLSDKYFKI